MGACPRLAPPHLRSDYASGKDVKNARTLPERAASERLGPGTESAVLCSQLVRPSDRLDALQHAQQRKSSRTEHDLLPRLRGIAPPFHSGVESLETCGSESGCWQSCLVPTEKQTRCLCILSRPCAGSSFSQLHGRLTYCRNHPACVSVYSKEPYGLTNATYNHSKTTHDPTYFT